MDPYQCPLQFTVSKSSNLASSDSTGTRISIGTSCNTTASPCGLKMIPKIDDIWQSATLDLRKSNKLDAVIDEKFPDNLVAPSIFTEVMSYKLSKSYIRDLYTRCRTNLAPQFVDLGIPTIDALDKGASIWNPANRVGRPTYIAHSSALDNIFENLAMR